MRESFPKTNEKKQDCVICFECLKPEDRATELPNCFHDEFHHKCLAKWNQES